MSVDDQLLVRAVLESLGHSDRGTFDALSDHEKQLVLSILREMQDHGTAPSLQSLWEIDYVRRPVDVLTFLTDKSYLGMDIIRNSADESRTSGVFETWAETLIELFRPDRSYWELILSSSIGTGKSSCAVLALVYKLYRMSCLRDPQKFYGLLPGHGIVFGVYNIFKYKAQGVAASYMREAIERCPYFRDVFPLNQRKTVDIEMPNSIRVSYGSCLAEGSMVQTQLGDVPIEEIDYKKHLVASFENGNVVFKRFHGLECNGRKPVFRLVTGRGNIIRATKDHKFTVVRGGIGMMLRLNDIRPGDNLVCLQDLQQTTAKVRLLSSQIGSNECTEMQEMHLCCKTAKSSDWPSEKFCGPTLHTLWESPSGCRVWEQHQNLQRKSIQVSQISLPFLRGIVRKKNVGVWSGAGESTETSREARVAGGDVQSLQEILREQSRSPAAEGARLYPQSLECGEAASQSPSKKGASCKCRTKSEGSRADATHGKVSDEVRILPNLSSCEGLASGSPDSADSRRHKCLEEHGSDMSILQYQQGQKDLSGICNLEGTTSATDRCAYAALDVVVSIEPDGYANTFDLIEVDDTHAAFVSRVLTSNSALHAIGENVFSVLIDETEFMKAAASEEEKGQAWNLYNSTLRRMESRYMRGGEIPGLMIQISSKASVDSYLADRIKNRGDDSDVLVVEKTSWEVKPWRYSGKRFWLFTGDSYSDPRILTDDDYEAISDKSHVMAVPVEHKTAFVEDIQGALRDLANVASGAVAPLIPQRESIYDAVDPSRAHPFTKQEFHIGLKDSEMIEDYLNLDALFTTRASKFSPRVNPTVPRYIHVDLAVSGDALGFCMGHTFGFDVVTKEDINAPGHTHEIKIPRIYIDLMLRIVPVKGSKIRLSAVKDFVFALRGYGYPIAKVTADTYQSTDMLQQLERAGFVTEVLSVDVATEKSGHPYAFLREAITERRINYYHYPQFLIEAANLQRFDVITGGKIKWKVDHPRKMNDLEGNPVKGCFTGDTRISLLSGEEVRLDWLAANKSTSTFHVYTIRDGKVSVGVGRNPRLTHSSAPTVYVELDSGEKIQCTPDHLFMLRDGTYMEAGKLAPGTSLMSVSIQINHKVVSVTVGPTCPVYDIEVDETSNFALTAGVFVHNSKDVADAVAGVVRHCMMQPPDVDPPPMSPAAAMVNAAPKTQAPRFITDDKWVVGDYNPN